MPLGTSAFSIFRFGDKTELKKKECIIGQVVKNMIPKECLKLSQFLSACTNCLLTFFFFCFVVWWLASIILHYCQLLDCNSFQSDPIHDTVHFITRTQLSLSELVQNPSLNVTSTSVMSTTFRSLLAAYRTDLILSDFPCISTAQFMTMAMNAKRRFCPCRYSDQHQSFSAPLPFAQPPFCQFSPFF